MAKENRLVILKTANKYFRAGKIDSAIKEYNKVLAIKPNDLEVRRIIGDLQLKQGNSRGAIEQFEWIADYYLKEGFFAKAIAMYKRITRIDPNYEGVSVKLAELYTKQGLIIEAKQIYLDLAEEYKRKKSPKRALDMYKRILEFDRNNIKMRMLLADNYLKEGLKESAVDEYLTAVDVLISKKDFQRADELLGNIQKKTNDIRVVQRQVDCYTAQGEEDKAIKLLTGLGSELFGHVALMKQLGELFFKQERIEEAEKIFRKITEANPEEKEIIMKLGRVYLQRNEYDKTYQLFLPVIEKNLSQKKFEEATSLLRFIIASNNAYVPALTKLAEIFKQSGKKNNLIALYESMIPVFEKGDMKQELIGVLEELIKLSESSFTYQEQLARLTGEQVEGDDEEDDEDREKEFITFNLRLVEDSVKESDFEKAISLLVKCKKAFPENLDVRLKLFDVYQMADDTESLMNEGVELLRYYQEREMVQPYNELHGKLSTLKPQDDRLTDLSGEEKTSIDITFDQDELEQNMYDLEDNKPPDLDLPEEIEDEKDVLVLSEDDSVALPMEDILADSKEGSESKPAEGKSQKEISKSLSSVFTELDFYISDGYFGDAEKLVEELRELYPENKDLIERIQRLQKAKKEEPEAKPAAEKMDEEKEVDGKRSALAEESSDFQQLEDSKVDIQIDESEKEEAVKLDEDVFSNLDDLSFEIEMDEPEKTDDVPLMDIDKDELVLGISGDDDEKEILADSKASTASEKRPEEQPEMTDEGFLTSSEDLFELRDDDTIGPAQAIESQPEPEKIQEETSGDELLDIDNLIVGDEPDAAEKVSMADEASPFEDAEKGELAFETEDDLLKDEDLFVEDEKFYPLEDNVEQELEAFSFWLEELERQRTSTTEKNMMEIFEEFKRGVEEKIGTDDYDTRYNLGIAYKEMGLLEEAIHEFLISSKHPLKFFDSAGLLGICFREKGMFDDAISWFEKALDASNRQQEEYLAVRYELAVTHTLREDLQSARSLLEEILRVNPKFRDVARMLQDMDQRS